MTNWDMQMYHFILRQGLSTKMVSVADSAPVSINEMIKSLNKPLIER